MTQTIRVHVNKVSSSRHDKIAYRLEPVLSFRIDEELFPEWL